MFLETGDPRLAKEQIAKLRLAPLYEVVAATAAFAADFAHYTKQSESLERAFTKAWQDLVAGMREGELYRPGLLKPKLVAGVLKRFPGVPNLHWLAGQSHGYHQRYADATRHYRWCLRLDPGDEIVQATLIACLALAADWKELDEDASSALRNFPNSSVIRFFVGWSIIFRVHQGVVPRSRLSEALSHLEKASAFSRLRTGHARTWISVSPTASS